MVVNVRFTKPKKPIIFSLEKIRKFENGNGVHRAHNCYYDSQEMSLNKKLSRSFYQYTGRYDMCLLMENVTKLKTFI